MSTPVRDPSWAGDLECSQCRRKRLTAAEFSKAQLQKRQKEGLDTPVRCKKCVESEAAAERKAAAERQAARTESTPTSSAGTSSDMTEETQCSACSRQLPVASFNRTQLSKGAGKQRCRECVEAAEAEAAGSVAKAQDAALEEARKALQQAEISGNAASVLQASSKLAALEAQKVTGLKPMVLGRGGRGRGRSRGGGKGR